jgi:Trk-type K+ transport system membrane component
MMVSMFLGRLGAITVVMSIAGDEAPEAIRYPQEDVMVG